MFIFQEWAIGAVASASALHAVGRGFESLIAHQPPQKDEVCELGKVILAISGPAASS